MAENMQVLSGVELDLAAYN